MDTNQKILDNRRKKRIENLEKETKILKIISELKDSDVVKKDGKRLSIKYGNLEVALSGEEKKLMQRLCTTLHKSMVRMNQNDYNIKKIEDISLQNLKDHAKRISRLDEVLRMYFVTEPHKQGVDEIIQRDLLNEGITKLELKAHAPLEDFYVFNGKILTKKIGRVKSIDTIVLDSKESLSKFNKIKTPEGLCALGTCKVTIESGGAQTGASDDVIEFLNQASKYCEENNNNIYFFAQVDGEEGNKLTPRIKKLGNITKENNRIFVGSTDDVINWLESIKKNEK